MSLYPEIVDRTFFQHLRYVNNLTGVRCEMDSHPEEVLKDNGIVSRLSRRLIRLLFTCEVYCPYEIYLTHYMLLT